MDEEKAKKMVNNYNETFEDYPNLYYDKGYILGDWMIGNYYKNDTDYYGAYPHGYLSRIMSMFEDYELENEDILHLFSGSLDEEVKGLRLDLNEEFEPEYVGDAEELSEVVDKKFKLILADPPYSDEDAKHYGEPMVNRNKVVKECVKVLEKDGILVWLDQVYPMYRKDELDLFGTIGLIRSTNHRVRVVFMYRRK